MLTDRHTESPHCTGAAHQLSDTSCGDLAQLRKPAAPLRDCEWHPSFALWCVATICLVRLS